MSDKTLNERAARLMREDAMKFVRAEMWSAKILCENEGNGNKDAATRANVQKVIDVLTSALAEYARVDAHATELESR